MQKSITEQQRRDNRVLLVVTLVDTDAAKRERVAADIQENFKAMLDDGTMQIVEVRKARKRERQGNVLLGGYELLFLTREE